MTDRSTASETERSDWPDPLAADRVDPGAMAILEETEAVRGRLLRWRRPRLLRAAEWLAARSLDRPPVGAVDDHSIDGRDGEIPIRSYRPPATAPVSLTETGPGPDDTAGSGERDRIEGDSGAGECERIEGDSGSGPGTVAFFHGGGFVIGSIETHDQLCRMLCRATGWRVVSVGYRRAPEHPFPAAVEDAIDATRWVADRSDGALVVAGDSAGGNLAAVVAYWAATADGPAIARQVLVYPGVDLRTEHLSLHEHTGLVLTEDALDWFVEAYYGSEIHLHNPYADPMAASDLAGVAPATILTAGFDPLRDAGLAYGDRLLSENVPVSRLHEPDMIHGFLGLHGLDRIAPTVDRLASEIRSTATEH